MKHFFKILITAVCLALFFVGFFICSYEIYNSYFSDEPKNIMTYSLASSGNASLKR